MNKKALGLLLLVSVVSGSVKAGKRCDSFKDGLGKTWDTTAILFRTLIPGRSINTGAAEKREMKDTNTAGTYKVRDPKVDTGEASKYKKDAKGTEFLNDEFGILIADEKGQNFVIEISGEDKFKVYKDSLRDGRFLCEDSKVYCLPEYIKGHFWTGVFPRNIIVPTAVVIVTAKVLKKIHSKIHSKKKQVDLEDEDFDA